VFPEGTSTSGATVRRFHPRLFQAAILAGCPVQAIALRYPQAGGINLAVPFVGDDELLPHLWRLLGETDLVAELQFGAVRFPPHPSRDALARQTHAEISTLAAVSVADASDQRPSETLPLKDRTARERL
jgi:1-acyl-sn-glycerol-3-phosphate acyltransferase